MQRPIEIIAPLERTHMSMLRPATADDPHQLNSWKEIAGYFHVSIRTVQRWERSLKLPVQRIPGPKGRIFATTSDLNSWLQNIPVAESPRMPTAASKSQSRPAEESDPPQKHAGTLLLFSGYCTRTLVRMMALLTAMLNPGLWNVWLRLRPHQRG